MTYETPLIDGKFVRRYKRFFADVILENGELVTAHIANSGSMKTCLGDNWPVRLSTTKDPKRKLKFRVEQIFNGVCWIGVHPALANKVVGTAIENRMIDPLTGYKTYKREVKWGEKSRLDFSLSEGVRPDCYVEVKSVSLVEKGVYQFPDAVTTRGQKHLAELMSIVKNGNRAALLFVVQRSDGTHFEPARHIDPVYAETLKWAYDSGVELLAYGTHISPTGIQLADPVNIRL